MSIAGEGVDFAIRYGSGSWASSHNQLLFEAPLTLLCRPETAMRLLTPGDIIGEKLLRSYRHEEWDNWFAAAGIAPFKINGPVFDSSRLIIDAVMIIDGVALAPDIMFQPEIKQGLLVRPFDIYSGDDGYWLTWQRARKITHSMQIFREWIIQKIITQ